MVDKGRCDNGLVWNPSRCDCECIKSCSVGVYSKYVNCKCRKRLFDELVKNYNENIDGYEMVYNATLYNYGLNTKVCRSCTLCAILLIIAFILIIMGITGACFYFYQYVERNYVNVVSYK